MSRFDTCVERVLVIEGGLVNDPDDPGGLTKYGISQRAYPMLDIANLTREQAIEIYRRDYWDKSHAGQLPVPVDAYVFDSAINQGAGYAIKQLQEVVGTKPDGIFGPITLRMVWYGDRKETGALYLAERAIDYMALMKFSKYGRGWLKRLFILAAEGSS